ncbi:hypothetical protein [Treponema sp.]|uniref:hypothetical protein n=1 Tax=Treponema sp. TaxID=166 RepID=UPI003F0542C5
MKLRKTPLAVSASALLLGGALFASDAPVKQNAWFDLKMHNTVGYNLEEKIYGMESTIDQAQIWWDLFTQENRGYESETDNFSVYFRVEDLRYVFKFYDEKKTYLDSYSGGDDGNSDTTDSKKQSTGWEERPGTANDKANNYFDYSRIVAGVKYKNYFMEFYNYDYEDAATVGFNHSSLKSIFDDFRSDKAFDSDKDNALGFLYYNGIQDTRNFLDKDTGDLGLTGVVSAGAEFDTFKVRLSTGAAGSWVETKDNVDGPGGSGDPYNSDANIKRGKTYQKYNEGNAGAVQLDLTLTPTEQLEINLSGMTTFNFKDAKKDGNVNIDFEALSTAKDIRAFGGDISYKIPAGKGVIVPYAGADFNYSEGRTREYYDDGVQTTDKSETQFEVGGGLAWYPRGADAKAGHESLDFWGRQFPIGCSVGVNTDNNGIASLVVSAFETPDENALIPNLGGFLEFEWVNFAEQDGGDSRFFAAAQLEYMIRTETKGGLAVGIKPYVLGRCIQRCSSNLQRTGRYTVDSRLGIVIYPSEKFNVDFRYERQDQLYTYNGDDDKDKGCITGTFAFRL